MNIFIARQPIFDRRKQVYGYELLFRQNNDNFFAEVDDDRATTDVIYNSFLVFGIENLTDDTKAFINFPKEMLGSEFLKILPKENFVYEILERGEITPETLEACQELKARGYILALDDFVLSEETQPLMEIASIVKIEYPTFSLDEHRAILRQYKGRIKFLAEKIETHDDYISAHMLGYDYFQGFYFSRPSMLKSKDISSLNINLVRILEELNAAEPSYSKIADIITTDVALSYKLLKLVNSAYIAPRYEIKSILHALNFLGTRELYQWMTLMMLKDFQDSENAELIRKSLIRGKLMSSLAEVKGAKAQAPDYFFTGIFSLMDVILNKKIDEVLVGLPISDHIKQALCGQKNELRLLLDYIISFENAQWNAMDSLAVLGTDTANQFMPHYVNALKWARSVARL